MGSDKVDDWFGTGVRSSSEYAKLLYGFLNPPQSSISSRSRSIMDVAVCWHYASIEPLPAYVKLPHLPPKPMLEGMVNQNHLSVPVLIMHPDE